MSNESRYLAYLVRLWVTPHGKSMTCRAMLVDPHSEEKRGFSDLEGLFTYIREAVRNETRTEIDGEETEQEVSMVQIQWLIIVLLLTAVALILCEPVCRRRTH